MRCLTGAYVCWATNLPGGWCEGKREKYSFHSRVSLSLYLSNILYVPVYHTLSASHRHRRCRCHLGWWVIWQAIKIGIQCLVYLLPGWLATPSSEVSWRNTAPGTPSRRKRNYFRVPGWTTQLMWQRTFVMVSRVILFLSVLQVPTISMRKSWKSSWRNIASFFIDS